MKIPLDSVIIIDRFNEVSEATAYLGRTRDEARKEKDLLDKYPLLEIAKPVADLPVTLRREYEWKLPDAFRAALARHHGLELATRNTKDFSPETHDFVAVPYSL